MQYLALVTDYDGTLATDGRVDQATVESLRKLHDSGRKIILVTGRQLPELRQIFPEMGLADAVVAENGGVLYWPREDREVALAEPPPDKFRSEMQRLEVIPSSTGRVVFATWHPHEAVILETIQRLGIAYQIIFNKDAVMVLPSNVNKAIGLETALREMGISAAKTVGIGDAENDHAFLEICGVAVAVQNALPVLKERCDLVTSGDHGAGVCELISQLLTDDLRSLGPRHPRTKLPSEPIVASRDVPTAKPEA